MRKATARFAPVRQAITMLTAFVAIVAFWDVACCEYMNIKDFYTDPQMLALIKAAESNDIKNLKLLVNKGINPNNFGNEGMTPLLWVLGHQNKKALKALLSVGADPNLKDPGGDSPMAMAAGAKDTELMKILLDGGGDPNIRNDVDEPAIHIALGQRSIEHFKLLLDYGADINATDRTGTTVIIDAAGFNQFEIVHYLLERGADYKHTTPGNVSLAWRVQNSKIDPKSEGYKWREKVIKMLEERGVRFPVPHPAKMRTSAQ